jgi:hypothetical protein
MIKIINNILHLVLALLLAFVVGRAFVSILLIWGVSINIIAETQFVMANIFVEFLLFMVMYWSIEKIKTKRR